MNGVRFEPNPVFICKRCGKGFLRYPGPRDPDPMWAMLSGPRGEDCFGEIVSRNREDLTKCEG